MLLHKKLASQDLRGNVIKHSSCREQEAVLFRGQSPILHSPGILCELRTSLREAELQINWVVLPVGVDNPLHSRFNQRENMLEPQDGKTLRNLTLQVLDGGQKSVQAL